jgi:hypothetical protein
VPSFTIIGRNVSKERLTYAFRFHGSRGVLAITLGNGKAGSQTLFEWTPRGRGVKPALRRCLADALSPAVDGKK